MKAAMQLQELIDTIRRNLKAAGVDPNDYDASIECLRRCPHAELWVDIYERCVNY